MQYKSAAAQLERPLELDIREASTAAGSRAGLPIAAPRRGRRRIPPVEQPPAEPLGADDQARQARAELPVQAQPQGMGRAGALFSYGIDLGPIGRAGARYVDSILRGTSPADLAVQEFPKIEFAINLETAGRLGIKLPQEMIIRADEVYR